MDIQVHSLKWDQVSLKSELSTSGDFILVADDTDDVTSGKMKMNSITTFTAYAATSCDTVDGNIRIQSLVAFQAVKGNRDYFLCPRKPRNQATKTVNLRTKKIKRRKVFDKKESEIEGKFRKYWFILKQTLNSSFVYESAAYKDFFISVEGKKVLMRKSPKKIPTDGNYHIDILPALRKKYRIEVQPMEDTLHSPCWDVPRIEVCEADIDVTVVDETDVPTGPQDTGASFAELMIDTREEQCAETEYSDNPADRSPQGFTDESSNSLIVKSQEKNDGLPEETEVEMSSATDHCNNNDVIGEGNNNTTTDPTQYRHVTEVLMNTGKRTCDDTNEDVNVTFVKNSETGKAVEKSTETNDTTSTSVTATTNGVGSPTREPIPTTKKSRPVNRKPFLSHLFSCVSSYTTSD